jgi:hypothetical protein
VCIFIQNEYLRSHCQYIKNQKACPHIYETKVIKRRLEARGSGFSSRLIQFSSSPSAGWNVAKRAAPREIANRAANPVVASIRG